MNDRPGNRPPNAIRRKEMIGRAGRYLVIGLTTLVLLLRFVYVVVEFSWVAVSALLTYIAVVACGSVRNPYARTAAWVTTLLGTAVSLSVAVWGLLGWLEYNSDRVARGVEALFFALEFLVLAAFVQERSKQVCR